MMHLSGHPHVVGFKGAYEDVSHVHIVMVSRPGPELRGRASPEPSCWQRQRTAGEVREESHAACDVAGTLPSSVSHTHPCIHPPHTRPSQELCTGGELFEHIAAKGHYRERDAAHLMRSIVMVGRQAGP